MAIRRFTISALCSLALLSCNGNLERSEMEKESLIPVTLTVGGAKSSMDANGYVSFAPGDRIAVYDGTAVREFVTAAGGSTATFKGEVSESTTRVWVASPYDPDMTVTDGKIITYVPRVQYADQAGSFGKTANVSIGTAVLSEGTFNLELKNVSSLIPITVPAGVDSVLVSGLANEIVSGQFSADFGDPNGEISSFTNVYNKNTGEKHIENEIVLKAPGSGNIAPGTYYLCAKPGTLSGYRCLYYKTDGGVLKGSLKTSEPDVTLVRNGISTQGISFNPAGDWHEIITVHAKFRRTGYLYDGEAAKTAEGLSASYWPFQETRGSSTTDDETGEKNYSRVTELTTHATNYGYKFNFSFRDGSGLTGVQHYLNTKGGVWIQVTKENGGVYEAQNWGEYNVYLNFSQMSGYRLISTGITVSNGDNFGIKLTDADNTLVDGCEVVNGGREVRLRLLTLNAYTTESNKSYRWSFNYSGKTLQFTQWKLTWLAEN